MKNAVRREEVPMLTKRQFLETKADMLDEVLKRLSDAEEVLDRLEQLEVDNSTIPDVDALAVGDLVGDAYEAAEHLRDKARAATTGVGP